MAEVCNSCGDPLKPGSQMTDLGTICRDCLTTYTPTHVLEQRILTRDLVLEILKKEQVDKQPEAPPPDPYQEVAETILEMIRTVWASQNDTPRWLPPAETIATHFRLAIEGDPDD